jgi:integrase
MSKQVDRLTDRACRAAGVGMHHDGRGLYLVGKQGAEGVTKSWVLRYDRDGKQYSVGLGGFPVIALKRAREKALEAHVLRADGVDPLQHKRAQRAALRQRGASATATFRECAESYLRAHDAGWSRKHAEVWAQSLQAYAYPVLGGMPVDQIDTAAVLKVLQPIWHEMPTTASRLRNRIELVLDAARAAGHSVAENSARWRGHLDHLLAKPSRLRSVQHFPALPYRDPPGLMDELAQREGVAALALRFIALTAVRAQECLGMTWDEVDMGARLWVIPAHRMKARREFRVPLSDRALAVLERMPRDSDRIFPISLRVIDGLRKQIGLATTHGLRSSFRMWCAEETSFPAEVAEACLAHVTGSAVEQAYQRSDVLEKRRQLMATWGAYCTSSGEVVQLRAVS